MTFQNVVDGQGLEIAFAGMLIVFFALLLIVFFLTLMPKFLKLLERRYPNILAGGPAHDHGVKPSPGASNLMRVAAIAYAVRHRKKNHKAG